MSTPQQILPPAPSSSPRIIGKEDSPSSRIVDGAQASGIPLVADPDVPGGKRMPTLEDARKGYYTADGRQVVGLEGRYLGKNAHLDEAVRVVVHYYAETLQKDPAKAQLILREGFAGVRFHMHETLFADPNSGLQESIAAVMIAHSKPVFWGLVFGTVGREASTLYASQLLAQANTRDKRMVGAVVDDRGEVISGMAARGAELAAYKMDESKKSLEQLQASITLHEEGLMKQLRSKQRELCEKGLQSERAVTFDLAIDVPPEQLVKLKDIFNGKDQSLVWVKNRANLQEEFEKRTEELRADLRKIGLDHLANSNRKLLEVNEVPFYAEIPQNLRDALSLNPEFAQGTVSACTVKEAIAMQDRFSRALLSAGVQLDGSRGSLWFNSDGQQVFQKQREKIAQLERAGDQGSPNLQEAIERLQMMEAVNEDCFNRFSVMSQIHHARLPMDELADFFMVKGDATVTDLEWFRQGWMCERVTNVIAADPVDLGLVVNEELFAPSPFIDSAQQPKDRDAQLEALRLKREQEICDPDRAENKDKRIVREWLKQHPGAKGSTVVVTDIALPNGQKFTDVVLDYRVFTAIRREFDELGAIQKRREETLDSFKQKILDRDSAATRLEQLAADYKEQQGECDKLLCQHIEGYQSSTTILTGETLSPHGSREMPMRAASLQLPVAGQQMASENADRFKQMLERETARFGKILGAPRPFQRFPV